MTVYSLFKALRPADVKISSILPQSKPLMTMNAVQCSEKTLHTSPLDVAVASIDSARSAH
jgi:hypothetical protein